MPICERCNFAYLDGETHNCSSRRPPTDTERAMLRRNLKWVCVFNAFMSLATGLAGSGSVEDKGLNVILNFVFSPVLLVGGGYIVFRLRRGYRDL